MTSHQSGYTLLMRKVIAAVIVAIRLPAFQFLLFLQGTARKSISHIRLLLLLYPKGRIVRQGHNWEFPSGIMFSVALLAPLHESQTIAIAI